MIFLLKTGEISSSSSLIRYLIYATNGTISFNFWYNDYF